MPKVAVWATKLNLFIDPLGTWINQKTLHFSQFLGYMDGNWTTLAINRPICPLTEPPVHLPANPPEQSRPAVSLSTRSSAQPLVIIPARQTAHRHNSVSTAHWHTRSSAPRSLAHPLISTPARWHTRSSPHRLVGTPAHYHTRSLTHPLITTPSRWHTRSLPHSLVGTPAHQHTRSLAHPLISTPARWHTRSSPYPLAGTPARQHLARWHTR